jgi:hypothetical protein
VNSNMRKGLINWILSSSLNGDHGRQKHNANQELAKGYLKIKFVAIEWL